MALRSVSADRVVATIYPSSLERITMSCTHLVAAGLVACLMLVSTTFAGPGGRFVQKKVANPAHRGNEIFMAWEDLRSPRAAEFRAKYNLDEVIAGKTDDWQAILAIRHWVKANIQIENKNPTKTRGDAFARMPSG